MASTHLPLFPTMFVTPELSSAKDPTHYSWFPDADHFHDLATVAESEIDRETPGEGRQTD